MPYVNVPNDLSKIKTKIAFNLTKRQLICFGVGAAVGIPTYLLTRGAIGNTAALFVMLGIMLPAFMMAMYEKDGLPFEKVLRNILNTSFLRPGVRPYQTQNIYAPFTGKEEPIAENKKQSVATLALLAVSAYPRKGAKNGGRVFSHFHRFSGPFKPLCCGFNNGQFFFVH